MYGAIAGVIFLVACGVIYLFARSRKDTTTSTGTGAGSGGAKQVPK